MDGLWAIKSEGVGLIARSSTVVSKISNLSATDPATSQTDRQTDGRTDDMQLQYRALHYSASRGNNNRLIGLIISEQCHGADIMTQYHIA